jgi:putative photosynthetic complex assembly protein 2
VTTYALPVLFAVVAWWSMTGLILYLDKRPPRTFAMSLAGATLVLGLSFWELGRTAADTTERGALLAFLSSLGVWGWIEMSFLLGFITGPRRQACPAGCGGVTHFRHAVEAILYHEFAILVGAAAVFALCAGKPNPFGLSTFLLLWVMRTSAKLNLFLGVPNLGGQYLPAHLKYLQSFFRRRPMNLLFPVVVTIATIATVELVRRALAPGVGAMVAAGDTLLATLLALAVLEHWFLVLPMPSEALWRFGLSANGADAATGRSEPKATGRADAASEIAADAQLRARGVERGGLSGQWPARVEPGPLGDSV